MPETVIRRARPEDAEALSKIGRDTFVETFGHLYPPNDLVAFLEEAYSIDKSRKDIADPAKGVWIVEEDAKVVGHALAGPCELPHDEVRPEDGELKRLYILSAHRGGGTGTRLLKETFDWLEKDGPRTLWIGVWSENFGAQRLYERHGFSKAGEYEFVVGTVRDREFILRRQAGG